MADLIDRQAAIEVIDAVFPVDPMKSEYAQGVACGAALAKTYVKQLPSAQPRWIPVTERLPEENLPVLVAVKQKDRLPKWVKEQTYSYVTDIDVYDDGGFFYTHKNNVVAWMPLPEPYREDGNEQ